MKTSIEKVLFLLSVRHALIASYFLVLPASPLYTITFIDCPHRSFYDS
ncbi:hypothetical protein [Bacillus safensis]|nr:hypothetical protein [Bacillus safensis]KIL13954.1 hypothetical protein B4129_0789 [Bacillus safensis]